jgi:uncharacterized protein (UPF0332 family)
MIVTVSHQHFFDSAEALVLKNQKGKEIDFRNSISRAYYALFLKAREIAKKLPEPTEKLRSHEKVIKQFEAHPKLKHFVYAMTQRRDKRNNADYDTHLSITYSETESHYKSVKSMLEKLDKVQI